MLDHFPTAPCLASAFTAFPVADRGPAVTVVLTCLVAPGARKPAHNLSLECADDGCCDGDDERPFDRDAERHADDESADRPPDGFLDHGLTPFLAAFPVVNPVSMTASIMSANT